MNDTNLPSSHVMAFSNMTLKINNMIFRIWCHTRGHGFQKVSSSYDLKNIWMKKRLPLAKRDACKIMPEVLINIFIPYFFSHSISHI